MGGFMFDDKDTDLGIEREDGHKKNIFLFILNKKLDAQSDICSAQILPEFKIINNYLRLFCL